MESQIEQSNEFEFKKTKGFGAYNFVWHNTKVTVEETSFSVEHTRKILFFKSKPDKTVVDYSDLDKVEFKGHFSKADLISGIIIGIISIASEQFWGLLVTAFLVLFSYGKNIVFIRKDGSKVIVQCGGPLSGSGKDEFDRMIPMLTTKIGRQIYSAINDVPASDPAVEPRTEAEPAQTTKAPEELTPAQKREKERWRKEDARDREALDNLRNGISNKTGSFLSENMGGVIMTAVLIVMGEIIMLTGESAGGSKFLAFILNIIIATPLTFLGCFIGNKLRLMLHPDFVIADGFMGLLKEKFFWRFGPQLIGAALGFAIGFNIVGQITGIRQ